ncbi:hypothetical protein GCM10009555_063100 [Acrocarpospora macrocephala]|uniref:Uncharacterized protein n=1 Tax=Acrocarpospora macrocephala TaxID=150177 RepID=A0A5M3WF95_9ACTN|nr:hypothetical protein Amac_013500 [Acrocarpospora macrocephala]
MIPADAVWRVLASPAGARQWLGDPWHPGLQEGALVPVRGSRPAVIDGIAPDGTLSLLFEGGRRATVEVRPDGADTIMVVTDYGGDALAVGWDGLLTAARFLADRTHARRRPRQAVVVIHGMGNQRPNATVRRLGDALAPPQEQFSKPDQVSRAYDLRRSQLERKRNRPRTDIYELYWAHRVPTTGWGQLTAWLRSVFLRDPRRIHPRLRPLVLLFYGVLLTALMGAGALVLVVGTQWFDGIKANTSTLTQAGGVSLLLSLLSGAVSGVLLSTFGDVARYLDDAPGNVAVRQGIRDSGVALLRRLHEGGLYDRIVVVGHSLGSVIGYDIIRLYWAEVNGLHGSPPPFKQEALDAYRRLLAAPVTDLVGYQTAQRKLWMEYRRLGSPWLVTDFVTLGSPLSLADTLLARSPADLELHKARQELPTCPPTCDPKKLAIRVQYLADGRILTVRTLPAGAPFAVVRWTNLYFPSRFLFFGDPVGGPLAPVLGGGIKDVQVTTDSRLRRGTPLAHTSYWRATAEHPDAAVRALTEAVGIESGRWLNGHLAAMPWECSVPPGPSRPRAADREPPPADTP